MKCIQVHKLTVTYDTVTKGTHFRFRWLVRKKMRITLLYFSKHVSAVYELPLVIYISTTYSSVISDLPTIDSYMHICSRLPSYCIVPFMVMLLWFWCRSLKLYILPWFYLYFKKIIKSLKWFNNFPIRLTHCIFKKIVVK